MTTLYEFLGVEASASNAEITKAYHRLARFVHPDHNPGHEETFGVLTQAYEFLTKPEWRAVYDQTLLEGVTAPSTATATTSGVDGTSEAASSAVGGEEPPEDEWTDAPAGEQRGDERDRIPAGAKPTIEGSDRKPWEGQVQDWLRPALLNTGPILAMSVACLPMAASIADYVHHYGYANTKLADSFALAGGNTWFLFLAVALRSTWRGAKRANARVKSPARIWCVDLPATLFLGFFGAILASYLHSVIVTWVATALVLGALFWRLWRSPKIRPNQGEVWWADIEFEQGDGSKDRPCLVLHRRARRAYVLMFTSQSKYEGRGNYTKAPQYLWSLPKESWLRTDRIITVPYHKLRRRERSYTVGRVGSPEWIDALRAAHQAEEWAMAQALRYGPDRARRVRQTRDRYFTVRNRLSQVSKQVRQHI